MRKNFPTNRVIQLREVARWSPIRMEFKVKFGLYEQQGSKRYSIENKIVSMVTQETESVLLVCIITKLQIGSRANSKK